MTVVASRDTPVSIWKSSAGFPTVAEQHTKEGLLPYSRASRRNRRRMSATCAPTTPPYICASSTTTYDRWLKNGAHSL